MHSHRHCHLRCQQWALNQSPKVFTHPAVSHASERAEFIMILCLLQVLGFIYTAIVVVIRGSEVAAERGDMSDVKLFIWSFDALFAIPIVVFGFNCHANVVTIFT